MKKYISFFLLLFFLTSLSSCKNPEPVQYNVNKTPELQQYESELQAESAYAESMAQESLLAKEKAEEEEKAKEALIWKKKTINKDRVKVKGIYITDLTAGSPKMDTILSQIKDTALNALVIDIKNDNGQIVYQMHSKNNQEIYNATNIVKDMPALIERCHAQGLYLIARLVCFRDPAMGELRPEWMNQKADGSLFKDNSGMSWINPYKKEYWDYIAGIAESCAEDGFDEVQLDYVRFCTEKGMKEVQYPEESDVSKTQIITEFVRYMSDRLSDNQVFFSTDVFGTIIGSYVDSTAVGQDYSEMSAAVDYMCPMIYPSHYGAGNFGIDYPDTQPYQTIYSALKSSQKELSLAKTGDSFQATVRPWLQGFTASYLQHYISYGKEEFRGQIQGVYDSGYEEWLFWNAGSNYDFSYFYTKEEGAAVEQAAAEKRKGNDGQ